MTREVHLTNITARNLIKDQKVTFSIAGNWMQHTTVISWTYLWGVCELFLDKGHHSYAWRKWCHYQNSQPEYVLFAPRVKPDHLQSKKKNAHEGMAADGKVYLNIRWLKYSNIFKYSMARNSIHVNKIWKFIIFYYEQSCNKHIMKMCNNKQQYTE